MAEEIVKIYFRGQNLFLQYKMEKHRIKFSIFCIDGEIDDDSLSDEERYELESTASVEGYLKWDGCIDWTADAHFCGHYGFNNLAKVMEELYKIKSKEWPHGD